ncbi:proclotting enzyme [Drosophila nasuta]|uniref:proclotting enzyme n=1 Tax=Drosophila nasuta TaxID=42062 RepID=UPI00295EE36E|nr:proclotting enzyme [Drosophila nasuta]
MSSLLLLYLHLLQVSLRLTLSVGQRIPENPCIFVFQYVQSGFNSFSGEVTIQLRQGLNRVEVSFTQRDDDRPNAVGSLLPYPDSETVQTSSRLGKFRLSLSPNDSGLLPKVTGVRLNNATFCKADDYPPPSSFANRFYVIFYDVGDAQTKSPPWLNSVRGDTSFVENKNTAEHLSGERVPQYQSAWLEPAPPFVSSSSTGVQVITPPPPRDSSDVMHKALDKPFVSWVDGPVVSREISWPTSTSTQKTTTVTAITPAPPVISTASRFNQRTSFFSCGEEGSTTPFIQRGRAFPRGQYPWLAAVFHKEHFALAFKCGGSLISATMVITAGHCVYKIKEDRVVVSIGRYDLDNYHEDGEQGRDVVRILTHPDYSSLPQTQPDADLALVTLDRPIIFNDIIRPICLWEKATESEVTTEIGTVAGWGRDEMGNSLTRFPRVVEANIANETECARKWKVPRVMERIMCAGNLDGSGPCLGDSGGGLMMKRNNRWLLRGIVSQGERSSIGHCNLNQYVLYCDLSKHDAWIRENLN